VHRICHSNLDFLRSGFIFSNNSQLQLRAFLFYQHVYIVYTC